MTTLASQPAATMSADASPELPSAVWRMLSADTDRFKLARGLDAAWDVGLGAAKRSAMRTGRFMKRAAQICALDADFSKLTDDGLREIVGVVSRTFRLGRERMEDKDRAFALIREVARRQLGMKPYTNQVAAALAMDAGCVAELATGEGKTLVATMPACLAGWRARGCHVITVNDYLARRDMELMRPVYEFCGLKAAFITEEMDENARRMAYRADITYCTNKTVAADFLRDRLTLGQFNDLPSALARKMCGQGSGPDQLVMRGLEMALIDEADSVLIDEAATPLIIADERQSAELAANYQQAAAIAKQLVRDDDYEVNRRYREVTLTRKGKEHIATLFEGVGGVWRSVRRSTELVENALFASELFIRDQHYFVEDGKVIIIDEATGRAMPDRSWRAGMHQAVEAKDGLEITPDRQTLARISFQRFFRLYGKLCGMTGTGYEARNEMWQVYRMPIVRILTHRPVKRQQLPDRLFVTKQAKWRAVVEAAKEIHETGRPILIGTRSVEDSECLSALLAENGMEHEVLNAVRHAEEARIVARAGEKGRITVATNMAGRGTDIKLSDEVKAFGGLAVIATERDLSPRVDRQLFGRAGRQGDAGSAVVFLSTEDDLLQRFVPAIMKPLLGRFVADASGEITSQRAFKFVRSAQRRAEHMSSRQRQSVLRNDDWLEESLGFAGKDL